MNNASIIRVIRDLNNAQREQLIDQITDIWCPDCGAANPCACKVKVVNLEDKDKE